TAVAPMPPDAHRLPAGQRPRVPPVAAPLARQRVPAARAPPPLPRRPPRQRAQPPAKPPAALSDVHGLRSHLVLQTRQMVAEPVGSLPPPARSPPHVGPAPPPHQHQTEPSPG